MINPINPNQPQFVPAPAPKFNEGAGNVARTVTVLALSIISALASFALLPLDAAFLVSGGAIALLSMLCCCTPDENGRAEGAEVRPRWYQNVFPAFGNFRFPVFQPGPRVVVGDARPHYNAQPAGRQDFGMPARDPLDHARRVGVPVMHPAFAPAPQARVVHDAPRERVPVGHARR